MKRNVVQDVLPPKKTIRNIEPPSRNRHFDEVINKSKHDAPIKIEAVESIRPPTVPPDSRFEYDFERPGKRSKRILYVAGGLLVLVIIFGISALFRSAEIKISPREMKKNLDEVFSAKKEVSSNGLNFQVVSISKDVEKVVDSSNTTGQEKVERKASGRIVIYNDYSQSAQKLVATTRFETPEGIVYRIKDPVTIPGKSIKSGKSVPGSVEVTVEADKSGPSYNIGLKDFTIPGFKGDPKFRDIYARSKTEMTGGFSGIQKSVPKDLLTSYEVEMEESLKGSLYSDLTNQIPSDFVLFNGSLSYRFEPVDQMVTSAGDVILKKKGSTTAVIFDRVSLIKAIQAKILPESNNELVGVSNLSDLVFSFNPSGTVITNTTSSVSFSLKGEPNFVWLFDSNKLKNDLLGLSKKNAKIIISSYSGIKEAWILTRPFWNQKVPTDPEKVRLINTADVQTD